MFVVWKWTWANYDYNTASSVSSLSAKSTCGVDSEASSEASSDEPDIPFVTHSVVFKCIGSTKESTYQGTLALVKEKLVVGAAVPVRLKKEPNNPKDSRAIAFECKLGNEYVRIGYVVREALDAVHDAIDQQKILKVEFDYVKFVVQFKDRGWYAGISITRIGQ